MSKKVVDENGRVFVEKNPVYKRPWFVVLMVVLVIAIISSLSGESKSDDKKSNDSQQTASEQKSKDKSKKEEKKSYGIGQTVPVGDVEYKINSKKTVKRVGSKYFGKDADGVYLILNVSIKNNGKKPLTVSDSFFKLLKGDTEYGPDSSAGIYANENADFFYKEVNPGNVLTGNVVFDVTKEVAEDSSVRLQVQTGVWGTEKEKINLK